jgi:hypothetical protein
MQNSDMSVLLILELIGFSAYETSSIKSHPSIGISISFWENLYFFCQWVNRRVLTLLWARVAQSVWWLTVDWTTVVWSLAGAKNFSYSLCIQTSSGVHPNSYLLGTGGPSTRGKAWPGHDTDHSPPSSAEFKKE